MIADRPLIGILFMVGFCVFAPMGDAAAKSIGLVTPLIVLLLARYLTQWLMPLPLILITGRKLRMTSQVARMVVIRSAVHIFLSLIHI